MIHMQIISGHINLQILDNKGAREILRKNRLTHNIAEI